MISDLRALVCSIQAASISPGIQSRGTDNRGRTPRNPSSVIPQSFSIYHHTSFPASALSLVPLLPPGPLGFPQSLHILS